MKIFKIVGLVTAAFVLAFAAGMMFSGAFGNTSNAQPVQAAATNADSVAELAASMEQEATPELASAPDEMINELMAQFISENSAQMGFTFQTQTPVTGTNKVGPGGRGPGSFPGGMGGPGGFGGALFNGQTAQGVLSLTENNGGKLTVGKRVVNLNDQTVVGDANGVVKKEDLKVGDLVFALGKNETDNSLTARYVLRLPALPASLVGSVVSVDATAKTLKVKSDKSGDEYTVSLTSSGKIRKDGADVTLADIKVDDKIVAIGKADATKKTFEAERIEVRFPGKGPNGAMPISANFALGTVKSVDTAGNSFVVTYKDGTTDKERKVLVDTNTKYMGTDLKALGDVKVGDTITAAGENQTDGSLKAKLVTRGGPGGPKRP